MALLQVLVVSLLVVLAYMTILWLVSLPLQNSSIVDIFWGPGFIVAALTYFVMSNGFMPRKWLVLVLVTIWGLRLGIHIFLRNQGKGEDFRYAAWRKEAGSRYWWTSFFRVFMLQGVLLWLISTPLLAAEWSRFPSRLTVLDGLGVVVWGVGFFFEAVGDAQLARFKRSIPHKGSLLTRGLWAYTRHPNYFGDAAQWWGYFLIALNVPFGFVTIYGPIMMTLLLLRVSGVALLERTLVETKPGYKEYVERTSAFFPWFPRQPKGT